MLRLTALFITLFLYFVPSQASAKSLSLVESCTELMKIYKYKDEKYLLASQMTSLSEGLRAGYCLGVIEQYAKTQSSCRSDWFKRAQFIASYALEENLPSDEYLLGLSCEI
ncbi:hypothetical protein KMU_31620 [Proteus vulgaris]|uniref:hypothetical protein n=1 Tax=Proteus TaxID=583 RepID=UPI0015984C76|nr:MULTISPECIES: hypothetical protein [Proteus]MBG2711321.1 hypothetical protein [Proteus mirabilis]MBG2767689.1 hypothetical protein [Proteus mirabilis]QKJ49510.1 hypothetical protein G9394_14725 [Proteus vulgaris]GLX65120.1 hypothetical protein KMU_31620 [Proteus vulgaris]